MTGKFIPLEVDGGPERSIGIMEVRVRFTNGMELLQSEGNINDLFVRGRFFRPVLDGAVVTAK